MTKDASWLTAVRSASWTDIGKTYTVRALFSLSVYLVVGTTFYRHVGKKECSDEAAAVYAANQAASIALNTSFTPSECEENWSVIDAIYFAMTTMSTVGYGDLTSPLGWPRFFTVIYILVGTTYVLYLLSGVCGGAFDMLRRGQLYIIDRFDTSPEVAAGPLHYRHRCPHKPHQLRCSYYHQPHQRERARSRSVHPAPPAPPGPPGPSPPPRLEAVPDVCRQRGDQKDDGGRHHAAIQPGGPAPLDPIRSLRIPPDPIGSFRIPPDPTGSHQMLLLYRMLLL